MRKRPHTFYHRRRHTSRRRLLEPLEPRLMLASVWQNDFDELDVNDDGFISPLDALVVINDINARGTRRLPDQRPETADFIDTDGDRSIAPLDALLVINNLNGGVRPDLIALTEGENFSVESTRLVELGQATGARTIRFDLRTRFDMTDQESAAADQLLVYLRDPTDGSRTLLDRGEPGTSLLSLGEKRMETVPGVVRLNGPTVEIDVTSLNDLANGQLVFQLLNHDDDTGSRVRIRNLRNELDPTGSARTALPLPMAVFPVGQAVDVSSLTPANQVELLVQNVRFDRVTGRYAATIQLRNIGPPVGRNVSVLFPGLPTGVVLVNASGGDANGTPFVNMQNAIRSGGLAAGDKSELVELLFDNPNGIRFPLRPVVLMGPDNRPPDFAPPSLLSIIPGQRLEVQLEATDPDGDPVRFSLSGAGTLPPGRLTADGRLLFAPVPSDIGRHTFTLTASDGTAETRREVVLDVLADPITTTRISGRVLDVDQTPIAGIQVEMGAIQGVTQSDGSFLLDLGSSPLLSDTLKIRGESFFDPAQPDAVYPFIAEKLPLVLEHDVFLGFNNVIDRPIFLPKLDVAGGMTIDPLQDTIVTSDAIPGAAVMVAAGTLMNQQGTPFTGVLSITEVPRLLTPAALPENVLPDLVVTIQPGEMAFTQPAPLSLPNRAGFPAGSLMELYSINPVTGQFDNVGVGQVSLDGSVVETIEGGVRNSSWHFFARPSPTGNKAPGDAPGTSDPRCTKCPVMDKANSIVEAHSGAVIETHELTGYQSLGMSRGLVLQYDSLRADPRPIVHFGFQNVLNDSSQRIVAKLDIERDGFMRQVPGAAAGEFGLTGGEHIWSLPEFPVVAPFIVGFGDVDASLQADLRDQPTGLYGYRLTSGLLRFDGTAFFGTTDQFQEELIHVNTIDSPFGAGWGLAGWQQVVENTDGSVLLVDGDGSELLFDPPLTSNAPYQSPIGDFTVLTKLADGTFRREFKDQTTYQFDAAGKLLEIRDRNGNATLFEYDAAARLVRIVDPVGLITRLDYTADKVSRITDPAGRVTQLEHDAAGNLTRVTDPDGSSRQWSYDGEHRMSSEIDQRGFREETVYDFAGRAVEAQHKDGSITRYRPVQTQGLFRAEETRDPQNPPVASSGDAARSTFVDKNGNVIHTTLDQAGQLVAREDAVGNLSRVVRDQNNLVRQQVDGRGHATRIEYDARGNVTRISDDIVQPPLLFPDPIVSADTVLAFGFAMADFNGDSLLDAAASGVVVVDGQFVSGIDVQLGRGNGTFGDIRSFPKSGDDPLLSFDVLRAADLDGDGDIDLAGITNSELVIMLNRGDGMFDAGQLIPVQVFTGQLLTGDLNSDGFTDLLAANSPDQEFLLFLGQGDGTFATAQVQSYDQRFEDVALGDLDDDGHLDLVVANGDGISSDGATILFGLGDGQFGETLTISPNARPLGLSLADLDGDGRLDIAAAEFGNNVIWLNTGNRTFTDAISPPLLEGGGFGFGIQFITAADVDTDGDIDLISRAANDLAYVQLNDGIGGFATATAYGVPQVPFGRSLVIVVEDLTGDELPEIILAGGGSRGFAFLLNQGAWPGDPAWETDAAFGIFATGDLNGDQLPDIVTSAQSGQVTVHLATGPGQFPDRTDYSLTGRSRDVTLADLNGDGRLDIVVPATDHVEVLLNLGDGTFAETQSYALTGDGLNLWFVVAGDVDGDDDLDLLFQNGQLLRNQGDGTFGTPENASLAARDFSVGDVNGDGRLDIVSAESIFNAGVLLGRGDGTFRTPLDLPTGFFESTLADMNEDGTLDLVQISGGGGRPFVLLVSIGNGDGTFREVLREAVLQANTADNLRVADVDGDGHLDVIFYNNFQGGVRIKFGDGRGGFSRSEDYLVSSRFGAFELVDLEGDGDLDLVGLDFQKSSDTITTRLNSLNDPVGRIFTYDAAFNQLSSAIDELGRSTLFEIDPQNGNTLAVTNVVGLPDASSDETDDVVTRSTYTADGLLQTVTDPLGRVTAFDYNLLGRLVTVTFAVGTPDEAARRFEYDLAGNLTVLIDENGNRSEFEYDARNRLTRVIEPDPDGPGPLTSPISTFVYDAVGNMIEGTDPRGNMTRAAFDEFNRLIQSTDAAGNVTRLAYDAVGNLTQSVDPLGNTVRNRYDARNRLVETVDPTGGTTRFTYDLANNPTRVTDPVGNTTQFLYDARSRVIREVDPLGGVTTFRYDRADNVLAQTDRNGRVMQFAYDDLNRLVAETWLAADRTTIENVITSTYDAASNLTSLVDNFSALVFAFDQRDRIQSVDNAGTPGAPQVLLQYTYDGAGNVLSVADAINGVASGLTRYTYDGLNRVRTITQTGNGVADKRVAFEYNALGQFAAIDRFRDVAGTELVVGSRFTYDDLNRLVDLRHNNGTDDVSFFEFAYDAASRITRIVDIDGTSDFTYDDRGQLTRALHSDDVRPDEFYAFDANGNRTSSHRNANGSVTGAGNRLLSDGQFDYEYDAEGNQIRRTEIASGNVRELTYDHRNRLTAVIDKDAAGTEVQRVEFTYDALGRRISKSVDENPNDAVDAVITHFVYDREDVILDFVDTDGAGGQSPILDQRYLHGPAIDQVLAQEDAAGEVSWLLADHLGTIHDITNNAGEIVTHLVFDSFGNLLLGPLEGLTTRYLFTNREFDSETGLYYYRARYYDPNAGRFLSEDPIGFGGLDANLFRYVANRPTDQTDPSGEQSLQEFVIIGVLVTILTLALLNKVGPEAIAMAMEPPAPPPDEDFTPCMIGVPAGHAPGGLTPGLTPIDPRTGLPLLPPVRVQDAINTVSTDG